MWSSACAAAPGQLNTWEFQAPDFYARCGYVVYGRETDFPPGHTNHLMRKDLLIQRIDDAR